jgi:hypothetical protein
VDYCNSIFATLKTEVKMKYKKVILIGFVAALAACTNAADKIKPADEKEKIDALVNNEAAAVFEFDKEFHDFGDINEGDPAQTVFNFKNTGESPLIITSAKGSCGCTVPDYPRKPIAPGESGEIKVSFDSSGRAGKQDKTVTIDANTNPRTTVLKITSNVMPKAGTTETK